MAAFKVAFLKLKPVSGAAAFLKKINALFSGLKGQKR
jgi:hypothetical protein